MNWLYCPYCHRYTLWAGVPDRCPECGQKHAFQPENDSNFATTACTITAGGDHV